jgi:predicted AAA+ superfamily ATPase
MLYPVKMFPRILQKQISKSFKSGKSILLLGPRQTGKSTLIQNQKPDFELNLIQQSTFIEVARDPSYLEGRLQASLPKGGLVFIDEIQRLPSLLNTVQALIDQKLGYQFALTGSSARKLKRGRANLLPGRVHTYELGPIIAPELEYRADTKQVLALGSLPGVLNESSVIMAKRSLKSYATTYLNEEIKAEALTKNIEGFTRFLFLMAAYSTQFLDLTKISKGAAVPRQTVQRYFEILRQTTNLHVNKKIIWREIRAR